ncbi:MAG TPA: polysaccharide biosynthesis C-terminal domain-containing protein [Solirubrobacteraceae bacterium]
MSSDILDSSEAGGRYLRGGGLRLVAYCAGLLVGLGVTPFVVRHLHSVGWGHYVAVNALIFIVGALTEGGLANLGVRELSTADEPERREYMRSLLGLRLALTAVGTACAIGFELLTGSETVLVEGTAIACVGLLLTNLQLTLALPLTAELRLGWLAVCDFLGQTITAAAMLTLVLLGASLLPFFAVTAIATTVTLALVVMLVRNQLTLRPAFHPSRWRALLSDSIVYSAATALGVVYFRLVVVATNLLTSAHQTGYFGLGFRIIDIVNAIPWLLVTSAFPILARAARDDIDRLNYALQRLFEGGLILGGWIALGLFVGAPFAIEVLGGASFHPSVAVLRILALGVPATFLVATWAFALLSLKRYRELIVVNGVIVVLAIVLCAVLIPAFGARGGAIVTATLEVTLAIGYVFALTRGHPDLRPRLGQTPQIALALALAFAAALVLPVHPVIAVAIGSLVFAAILMTLGALPDELIQALAHRRD